MSSSVSELFRAANKLSYEVDAQINEVHNGKYQSAKDLKASLVPVIRSKIAQLNS
jgi:hypothetical protein